MNVHTSLLDQELAEEIIQGILSEATAFDMDDFFDFIGNKSEDRPFSEFSNSCQTVVCITGMGFLLDKNKSFQSNKPYSPNQIRKIVDWYLYAESLFGPHYSELIHTFGWPENYRDSCNLKNPVQLRETAIVVLRDYCKRYLGFSPKIPRSVVFTVNRRIKEAIALKKRLNEVAA